MMALLGILVFSTAFGLAGWTIAATILPRLERIADALAGRPQIGFEPLTGLVLAERRIVVRRRMSASRSSVRVRAAA